MSVVMEKIASTPSTVIVVDRTVRQALWTSADPIAAARSIFEVIAIEAGVSDSRKQRSCCRLLTER